MAVIRQALRWILILFVGSLLLAVLLATGLLVTLRFHDGFRDRVLLSVLQPYGVVAISSQLESVTMDGLTLARLDLRYEDSDASITAELQQLSLQRVDPALPLTDPAGWELSSGAAGVTVRVLAAQSMAATHGSPDDAQNPMPALADFLPQKILQQVPLSRIHFYDLALAYHPLSGDPWEFTGQGMLSPTSIQSSFHLKHAEQRFTGEVTLQPENVLLSLGQMDKPWISIETRLEQINDQLVAGGRVQVADLAHSEDWLALLPLTIPETTNWRGGLDVAFSFTVPEKTLQRWLDGDTGAREGVLLTAHLVHDFQVHFPQLELRRIALKGSANVQLSGDSLLLNTWHLEQGNAMVDISDPDLQKRLAPLLGPNPKAGSGLTLQGSGELTQVRFDSAAKLPATMAGKLKFTLIAPDETRLKGLTSFNGKLAGAQRFKGNADILLDDLTQFTVGYHYQADKEVLDFTLNSARNNLATATFNEWATKLALPFQLELGDFAMAVTGRMALQNMHSVAVSGKVQVSDWHGNLENNHFESLTSEFDFSGDLNQFSLQGTVKNGLFDVGIPITDIRYDLTIHSDRNKNRFHIKLSNLESRLVGGLVRVPVFEWDNQREETGFNVVIYNWQFARIIELLKRDDLEVTGILDGMLPITVSGQGWQIHDGRLTAREPGGRIRYSPEPAMKASLSNHQQLKMATDILDNFQYHRLDAVLNQALDGTQYINLTLKGSNPDAYGGTPINLNLNIEHNITPLIESLTLPEKIQENWNNLNSINPQ